MTLRNSSLSSSDIIQRCHHPDREIIGGLLHGNLVIKLSEELVVKFGHGVSVEEADNQRTAFEILDSSIVRVPRVVDFFTRTDGGYTKGYLVMEYIHGGISNSVTSEQIDQIVKILSHFSTVQCQRPGPLLQPGVSRGLLWEENGKPTFETVEEMERWLNFRIKGVGSKLVLRKYPLVLCHLDLAPRNIVWLKDDTVCLLDWASAGFYPRFFEISLLKIMAGDRKGYETTLINRLEKLTDDEEAQMSLLECSYYNGIRYYIPECLEPAFSEGS
ncbi:kinase-like domain-containing protein [Leptodontidium sp. MPI-SDFR-AT-0119]|nr:kinase-like domain-containing protein [Leptodontidium sp. MPI-SDFR-AT-0119]